MGRKYPASFQGAELPRVRPCFRPSLQLAAFTFHEKTCTSRGSSSVSGRSLFSPPVKAEGVRDERISDRQGTHPSNGQPRNGPLSLLSSCSILSFRLFPRLGPPRFANRYRNFRFGGPQNSRGPRSAPTTLIGLPIINGGIPVPRIGSGQRAGCDWDDPVWWRPGNAKARGTWHVAGGGHIPFVLGRGWMGWADWRVVFGPSAPRWESCTLAASLGFTGSQY